MEKIKVIKSHPIFTNLMYFSLMAIVLVALQLSLQSNTTFLSKNFLMNLLINKSSIMASFLTLFLAYYFNKKLVQLFFRIFVLVVSFTVFHNLLLDFNKVILILLCGFITISYVFDQLLQNVYKMACYHSYFSDNCVWPPTISCPDIHFKQNNFEVDGKCINWDKDGLLLKFEHPEKMKLNPLRRVKLTYQELDKKIELDGEIVAFSHNYKILGIIILKQSKKNPVVWTELLDIWGDRGLDPEWVR